jgi:AcrR family transcriptional regulator
VSGQATRRMRRVDGRTLRSLAIKTKILRTCRDLMKLGNFQPSVKFVAGAAGVSTKTVFTHFGSVERLRCNALEDEATREAVARLIIGTEGASLSISTRDRVLRAVALGSLPEIGSRPTKRKHSTRIRPPL